ncbi:hypothetical protein GQ600_10157 [Phytophthora cactorum]|nr:hypothetical protein GQ600_10157 [Phytophthora cactorum]
MEARREDIECNGDREVEEMQQDNQVPQVDRVVSAPVAGHEGVVAHSGIVGGTEIITSYEGAAMQCGIAGQETTGGLETVAISSVSAQAAPGSESHVATTPPPAYDTRRGSSGQSPSIAVLYVDILAAFSPAKEGWTSSKKYVGVGNAYIIGRVCRIVKDLYQVRWLDTQFQSHVEI